MTDHEKSLNIAYEATTHQGLAASFGVSFLLFIMFCSYALALCYGSWLIINHGYSGGSVINVIFAVLTGGM